MTTSERRRIVESVLNYIRLYIEFSSMVNDRDARLHWEECWTVVFRNFFGSYKPPRRQLLISYPAIVETPANPRPRWFVEKYSRPARKVIGRMTERLRTSRNRECFSVTWDVLECGHKVESRCTSEGIPPARWRYCKECPPKNQQMREAGMTGSASTEPMVTVATAFAVASAVNTISRARRVKGAAA